MTRTKAEAVRIAVSSLLMEASAVMGGGPDARLDAEVLLAHALGAGREWLHAHPEAAAPEVVAERFLAMSRERGSTGVPVALLTGKREFHGLTLAMRRGVFVPRPETEGLVDLALSWLKEARARGVRGPVADPCCGTGAVGLAIAAASRERVVAGDRNPLAVETARGNAAALGLASLVTVAEGDLMDQLAPGEPLAAVVCNPPYVDAAGMAALPRGVRDFDPREALDGGPDGLDIVRRLGTGAAERLAPGGLLALEIGDGQGAAVVAIMGAAGLGGVRIGRDLAGRERYALAEKPS